MSKTVSQSALSFAALCAATDKQLDVALASATADQLNEVFALGARDIGDAASKVVGKVATLAVIAGHMVDIDDNGKVNSEQREAVRVTFQREIAIGWLMAGNVREDRAPMTEDKAREELTNLTELGKKARGYAQSNWARVLDKAELRDPETDEDAAKREEAAAKKAATKAAKKAEKAQADADKAQADADAATSARSQAVAPTQEPAKSDADKAATIDAAPTAVLEALLRLSGDAMLATMTQAARKAREAGTIGKAGDHALAQFVLIGAQWRKDRDAEVESAKASPANAELEALRAELAALKAAHGPASPAAPAETAKPTPRPRTARGK